MRAFIVAEGTEVRALRTGAAGAVTAEEQVTKREAMFFLEDITVDPMGHVGISHLGNTIGAAYAEAGWYGFRLPRNAHGYETMLVPADKVDVR